MAYFKAISAVFMQSDVKVIGEGYKRLSEGLKIALNRIIRISMPIYVRICVNFIAQNSMKCAFFVKKVEKFGVK